MIADGRVEDTMRVIVGKPETPTPELHDVINYATVNPYWHVTPDMWILMLEPSGATVPPLFMTGWVPMVQTVLAF